MRNLCRPTRLRWGWAAFFVVGGQSDAKLTGVSFAARLQKRTKTSCRKRVTWDSPWWNPPSEPTLCVKTFSSHTHTEITSPGWSAAECFSLLAPQDFPGDFLFWPYRWEQELQPGTRPLRMCVDFGRCDHNLRKCCSLKSFIYLYIY